MTVTLTPVQLGIHLLKRILVKLHGYDRGTTDAQLLIVNKLNELSQP